MYAIAKTPVINSGLTNSDVLVGNVQPPIKKPSNFTLKGLKLKNKNIYWFGTMALLNNNSLAGIGHT